MELFKQALIDVVKDSAGSSLSNVVLVKGKTYRLSKDSGSNELYVQGEDGLFYLLWDHPDWFGERQTILPFIL